jgi:hypothetical protein
MRAFKTILSLACLSTSIAGYSKVTDHYRIHVQPVNSQGSVVEFLTSLGDWDCSSSLSTNFSSTQKDNRGLEKRLSRKNDWSTSFDTHWQGQPSATMSFSHNRNNSNPSINIYLRESCEKYETEYQWVTVTNPEDGTTSQEWQPVTERYEVYKTWNCVIPQPQFPNSVEDFVAGECQGSSSSYTDWDFDSLMLSSLREKRINFVMEFTGRDESFIRLNNKTANTQPFVFNISQGLDSSAGSDFSININVNGITKVIETSSGLLNEDFVYYAPKGTDFLNISFSGVEDDIFFDDEFNAISNIKLYKNSTTDRIVSLTSHGLFGEGNRSMMRVKLLQAPSIEAGKKSESTRAVIESMRAKVAKEQSIVAAQMQNINSIRSELMRAEDNFSTAKVVSIPVSIVGAGIVLFGNQSLWSGEGIDTSGIIATALGGAMIAGSATAIILTKKQVDTLLAKLKEVEADFQKALEKLQARQLKLEAALLAK